MLEDYFKDLTFKRQVQTADDLGGFITTYEIVGTAKGLLQRSSSQERLIAAQLGIISSYTLMTKPKNNLFNIEKNMIVSDGTITARINSDELPGQAASEEMSEISQWTAETYEIKE